jgi:hypothetical protein
VREPDTVTPPSTEATGQQGWPGRSRRKSMICPLLTYADMQKAMAELAEVFQLRIVWLSDDAARSNGAAGRPWRRPISRRSCTAATSAMAGPTYESPIPMRTTRQHSTAAVTS